MSAITGRGYREFTRLCESGRIRRYDTVVFDDRGINPQGHPRNYYVGYKGTVVSSRVSPHECGGNVYPMIPLDHNAREVLANLKWQVKIQH